VLTVVPDGVAVEQVLDLLRQDLLQFEYGFVTLLGGEPCCFVGGLLLAASMY
jgi:organic radical activating enzyme